jgi:hypothetical protein
MASGVSPPEVIKVAVADGRVVVAVVPAVVEVAVRVAVAAAHGGKKSGVRG